MKMMQSLNVFDEPLEECGTDPAAGFFRDNKCNACTEDVGSHTVCVQTTQEFLEYSRFKGNDLSTPAPEYGFPGLKPGDSWCLCAARWLEAHEDDRAPRVYLKRTHKRALEVVPMDILRQYSVDLH
jgi:uncharacterized protein (DUF2237 family)